MKEYIMSDEEKEYLKHYNISDYERPSVTADMAVFAIMGTDPAKSTDSVNCRKDPERRLKILLIRRANHPYKGAWALPGGFCHEGESTTETARRELCEETGIKDAYLKPFDVFGEPKRDPRGWIISHAFLTLIDGSKYRVHAGSDAWEAEWFFISIEKKEVYRQINEEDAHIQNSYSITLTSDVYDELNLTAEVAEDRKFVNYHETVSYDITDSEGIGFDHAKIILCAFLTLQKEVNETGRPVFDLMPEKFTLSQLQSAFEAVQGKKLLTANFRRKTAGYVTETDEMAEGAWHRPAKLFKRRLETFYR